MRTATLDFYSAERARPVEEAPLEIEGDVPVDGPLERIATGFDGIDAVLPAPDGAVLLASSGTIYRWHDGVVSVFRPKSAATALAFSPAGLLLVERPEGVLRVNPHGDTTLLDGPLPSAPTPFVVDADGGVARAGSPGSLQLPERARSVAADGATLYVGGESSLFRIRVPKGAS
jgi:hypothetical protein